MTAAASDVDLNPFSCFLKSSTTVGRTRGTLLMCNELKLNQIKRMITDTMAAVISNIVALL